MPRYRACLGLSLPSLRSSSLKLNLPAFAVRSAVIQSQPEVFSCREIKAHTVWRPQTSERYCRVLLVIGCTVSLHWLFEAISALNGVRAVFRST